MLEQPEWRSDQPSEDPLRRNSTARKPRTMADLLFLPDAERSLMNWLLRQQQATLPEIAAHLNQSESAAQILLNELMAQGFIQTECQPECQTECQPESDPICRYLPNLISRKNRNVPTNIWDALQ